MVSPHGSLEWQSDFRLSTRPHNRVRRQRFRLGHALRGFLHRRKMVLHRMLSAYQLLMAGSFAIRCWIKQKVKCSVLLKMDNVAAVRYANHLGETRSKTLLDIARTLWEYCLSNQISLSAEHLPGSSNQVADWHSRHWRYVSLWKLNPQIFCQIQTRWGPFSMDLFAYRLDFQLNRYCSWRPDPQATALDAFLQDWSKEQPYAFPPFAMITRLMAQVCRQRAEVVEITPSGDLKPGFQ